MVSMYHYFNLSFGGFYYVEIVFNLLKIGAFTFGGGCAMVLIQDSL